MELKTNVAQLLASAALAAALAFSTGGCSNIGSRDTPGSVTTTSAAPANQDEWRRSLEALGARYRENPNDADAAIAYARALRTTDQRAQAVAVLEQASIRNPRNMSLLGAYGRALADAGQYQQALSTLDRAHLPDNSFESRTVLSADERSEERRNHVAPCGGSAECWSQSASESCIGGRLARPFRGSGENRPLRPA